jgi:hypothetical protein
MSGTFNIVIHRLDKSGNLVTGTIDVNGVTIGSTYENDPVKIPAGVYVGCLRYHSGHNFVQGPHGVMGKKGDLLIEVSGVKDRDNILLHGGNKAKHSKGCVLLGPVSKNKTTGAAWVDDQATLRKLRLLFYGTDEPVMCPDKTITIHVVDAFKKAPSAPQKL